MPPRRARSPLQILGVESSSPLSHYHEQLPEMDTIESIAARGRSATGGVQDGAVGHGGRQVLGRREGDRRGVSGTAKAREFLGETPCAAIDPLAEAADQHVGE